MNTLLNNNNDDVLNDQQEWQLIREKHFGVFPLKDRPNLHFLLMISGFSDAYRKYHIGKDVSARVKEQTIRVKGPNGDEVHTIPNLNSELPNTEFWKCWGLLSNEDLTLFKQGYWDALETNWKVDIPLFMKALNFPESCGQYVYKKGCAIEIMDGIFVFRSFREPTVHKVIPIPQSDAYLLREDFVKQFITPKISVDDIIDRYRAFKGIQYLKEQGHDISVYPKSEPSVVLDAATSDNYENCGISDVEDNINPYVILNLYFQYKNGYFVIDDEYQAWVWGNTIRITNKEKTYSYTLTFDFSELCYSPFYKQWLKGKTMKLEARAYIKGSYYIGQNSREDKLYGAYDFVNTITRGMDKSDLEAFDRAINTLNLDLLAVDEGYDRIVIFKKSEAGFTQVINTKAPRSDFQLLRDQMLTNCGLCRSIFAEFRRLYTALKGQQCLKNLCEM